MLNGFRTSTLALVVMGIASASGCASIVKGSEQEIAFKSRPSAASLKIIDLRNNEQVVNATTPYTATLKKGAGYFKKAMYKVVVEKEGYKKREIPLEGSVSGWYIGGNFVFGGLIGWLIVDPISGAMWKLAPEELDVTLAQKLSIHPHEGQLTIVLKDRFAQMSPQLASRLQPLTAQ